MKIAIIALLVACAIASPISNDVEITPAFNVRQDTRFLLFTRFNPTIPHIININDVSSIANSHYSRDRPLRVLIHGWQSDASSDINILTTAAFMRSYDVNVIVVDWGVGADNNNYVASRNQVNFVGALVAELLDSMAIGGYLADFGRTACIGHSLGAHICGITGKRLTQGRLNTIIGQDPAGPLFSVANPAARLADTDAEYVEVIHTDTRSFGIADPIGHSDFYPNGGSNQPSCLTQICDHNIVNNFFVESLNSDRLWGRRCDNIQQMENNACSGPGASMGGEPSNHRLALRGIYRFATNSASPFGQGPF